MATCESCGVGRAIREGWCVECDPGPRNKDWWVNRARAEGDTEIAAGALARDPEGDVHHWYPAQSLNGTGGVEFCDFRPGVRGRVSINTEDGVTGYTATLFDGSQKDFLAQPSLGKFPTAAEAKKVCARAALAKATGAPQ